MVEKSAFSVRIFIPNGEPEGLRIIEKSNWTGQGLAFPRAIYAAVRGQEEFKRTGVYVLWCPTESGELPLVYVGEGDLRDRLDTHEKNKDFWTQAVTFTSKDQYLNKAHAQYLEAHLVSLAYQAKRCQMDNANFPKIPSLSAADAADADLFLADMIMCLPILGVNFFNKPRTREKKSLGLFLKTKGITAQGYDDAEGFFVQSGSQAVKEEVASIHGHVSNLRKVLLEEGLLEDAGSVYRLTQDYLFTSPSTASGVFLGNSSNGRVEWKDDIGRSLKEIQEAAMESLEPK